MEVGEVLLVDDQLTGFDDNKPARPCMVVRLSPRARPGAYVVPRTTTGRDGVLTPAGVLPGLKKPGRFMYNQRFVKAADLEGCRSLGVLPEKWQAKVLEQVSEVEVDL